MPAATQRQRGGDERELSGYAEQQQDGGKTSRTTIPSPSIHGAR